MFINQFQKCVNYLKEANDIALFASMADPEWTATFRASPLFYIMLPFIAVLLTVNALLNGYHLAKASNRNFDKWFLFLTSMTCAVLASVSLYGAVIAMALGGTFLLGPVFFLCSISGACAHQLVMFGLNLHRIFESPKGSVQRMHHLQAALHNVFAMTLMTAIIGTVIFGMIVTSAPILASAFAISAVALTFINVLWRVTPHNWKQMIKGWFGMNKPELAQDAEANYKQIITSETLSKDEPKYSRLFTRHDYRALTRKMDTEKAKDYLLSCINLKLKRLFEHSDRQDEKTKDKISLLKKLLRELKNPNELSKEKILKRYPLAFENFWAEKGEVEQLFDAVAGWIQDRDIRNEQYELSRAPN